MGVLWSVMTLNRVSNVKPQHIQINVGCIGTGEMSTHSFVFEGYNVHLVDTPGFNVRSCTRLFERFISQSPGYA
jgi:hypothetical protein